MKGIIIFIISMSVGWQLLAQDLLNTRIRAISGRKKAIYFDKGIFHNDGNQRLGAKLVKLRESYVPQRGYERIVFDFDTPQPPAVYGSVDGKNKKIYLDLFNTQLQPGIKSLGSHRYLKQVNFFPIDRDSLSVELLFKQSVVADIFYLKNPGRLVIDVKQ